MSWFLGHYDDTKPYLCKWDNYEIGSNISAPDASELMVSHGGYDNADVNSDVNCMFPIDRLNELAKEGFIKEVGAYHYGFMGGGGDQQKFTQETGPEIARRLVEDGVDAVLLTAG